MKAPIIAAVASLAIAQPVLAQPLTREDLEKALAQRDQEIAALEKRIATLESERATTPQARDPVVETAPAAPVGKVAATAAVTAPNDSAELQALSRGLVQRGLLLLPPWSVEISPGVAYSHSQEQGLVLVQTPEGISTVSDQRQRDDGVEPTISARVGLPWRSQIQVSVPFDWRRDSSALGDGTEVTNSATHFGDVQIELSHQFVLESGWAPDVVGGVTWRVPTGLDPYKAAVVSVANGAGSNGVSARLTALKTIDPLVVYSTVSYIHNFSYPESFGRVQAGDSAVWQLGGLLAVSPDTSLSFGFDQQFKMDTRVDGARIPGSDGVAAAATFGLDQVLSARALLDISLGVGLTRDAPNYVLMVSLPIRLR